MEATKFFTVILGILAFSPGFGQNLDEVKDLIENERYHSAEQVLEKNDTGDPEANYLLVKSYLEQDKLNEATVFFKEHIQTGASGPLEKLAYARYLFENKKKDEANQLLYGLLEEKKLRKDAALLSRMAEVIIDAEEGDAHLALTWLELAEKRDKSNPTIDILRGLAYRKLSDASKAYQAYQAALKKDPNNVRAHYLLGKIFRAQKNAEVYMQHFMKTYELDSNFAPVLEDLYNHYYYLDLKLARKFLEKYIANTDYSIQNDYYLTDIYYLTADYARAIRSAESIREKQGIKAQPRLYKLEAYSYAKAGDSVNALQKLNDYFSMEDPSKLIAADFELRGDLLGDNPEKANEAATYYKVAFEMDSVAANKIKYASAIAKLARNTKNYSEQAYWLGKLFSIKEKANNLDLFNWGLAYFKGNDFVSTDSVFTLYTKRYPEDIYGYYWRAQANAAIDTTMEQALAIPHYLKVAEIGAADSVKNRKMLLTAYGYLGSYEANITKNFPASLSWFRNYLALDSGNVTIKKYVDQLEKWIEQKK